MAPRLIANHGTRHVEALDKADALAEDVDRVIASAFRQLARLVKADSPYSVNYHNAAAVIRRLPAAINGIVAQRLRQLHRWGHDTAARLLMTLPKKYLRAAVVRESRLLERVDGTIRPEEEYEYYLDLIFPPPPERLIDDLVFGGGWQARIDSLTRLQAPAVLAGMVAGGMAEGKTQQEIARDLLPALSGVRSSARRVARAEGIRVLHGAQFAAWEKLGDMVVGYQVHATLDDRTRSWHAARNGQVYYKDPAPGEKGLEQMPHPPEEPEDQRERPVGEPKYASNCRCWIVPVLTSAESIERDPVRRAVFTTAEDMLVPDPLTYSEWFDNAPLRLRRKAVGARRYEEVATQGTPTWADFLDPTDGSLMSFDELRRETDVDRAVRAYQVRQLIQKRGQAVRQVATFGY